MIEIRLPWPISANRYWRSFVPRGHKRAIVVISEEAKAYKAQVWHMAKNASIHVPAEGRVQVDCQLFPALPVDAEKRMKKFGDRWSDSVRSIDLDNALKVTIDALKGIAYRDDKQVWKLSAQRMEPIGEACIVVRISEILPEPVQQRLEFIHQGGNK